MAMIHVMSSDNSTTLTNVQDEDVQPNAVDIRLAKVYRIKHHQFMLSENNEKVHRGTEELVPDDNRMFHLYNGTYEVVMDNIVSVGPNEAGWVITRSTLNRNGIFLTSGLYDSGYHGVMAAAMHVNCGEAQIEVGARIGQFILFDSPSMMQYTGSYGLNSEHDKKYGDIQ